MVRLRLSSVYRRVSLAVSLFGVHLFEDPNDLFMKISQKLRSKSLPVPVLKPPTPNRKAEQLFEVGELSESAALFARSGILGRSRARKIRRQTEELAMPIRKSTQLEKEIELSDVNVLFYLTNSKPFTQSGYTERTQQLLTSLKNEGINVRGVTRLGYPVVIGAFPLEEKTVVDGIVYMRLLPTKYPILKSEQTDLAVEMLVREARVFNATILHTTTDFKNAIVVSRAAEILGIPWIYETRGELHKTWLSKRPGTVQSKAKHSEFYRAAERKELEAMECAAAVVQLSQVSKKQAIAQGINEDKIAVVPNAVSTRELCREYSKFDIRDELGLDKDQKIVGSVTSLVQYEGLDDLISAVALLPEVHCLIVGDGEARPELEALSQNLQLTDRVHFVGKMPSDTIWKWYAALDVFAIPRKDHEVCRTVTPIKTLLAQANGVPVVASDLPALREVTGGNAMYTPSENPQELARTITKLLTADDKLLDSLREQAANWVSTRTWRANSQRLEALYAQGTPDNGLLDE